MFIACCVCSVLACVKKYALILSISMYNLIAQDVLRLALLVLTDDQSRPPLSKQGSPAAYKFGF